MSNNLDGAKEATTVQHQATVSTGTDLSVINEGQQKQKEAISTPVLIQIATIIGTLFIFIALLVAFSPLISVFIPTLHATLISLPLVTLQPLAGWYPILALVYTLFALAIIGACYCVLGTFVLIMHLFCLRPTDVIKTKKSQATTTPLIKKLFRSPIFLFILRWLLYSQGLYLIYILQPQTWWLWTTGAYVMLFLHQLHRVFHATLKNARVKTIQYESLKAQLTSLTRQANIHVQHFLMLDTPDDRSTPETLAGTLTWGNQHIILLSSHIIHQFSLYEIRFILAHELEHIVHFDRWKKLICRALLLSGTLFVVQLFLPLFLMGIAATVEGRNHSIPFFVILTFIVLFILIVLPILIYWRYLKKLEIRADKYAFQQTGDLLSSINALMRLYKIVNQHSILPPEAQKYTSYPSLQERLEHLAKFAGTLKKKEQAKENSH